MGVTPLGNLVKWRGTVQGEGGGAAGGRSPPAQAQPANFAGGERRLRRRWKFVGASGEEGRKARPCSYLGQFFAIVQRFLAMGVLFFREDMLR